MNRVSVLDCTLRDGGYVNDFAFGRQTIRQMIRKLSTASIDMIECGFLRSGASDPDRSLFGSVEAAGRYLGEKNKNALYVAMIRYGDISDGEIAPCDGSSLDGIRISFHQQEAEDAFLLAGQLMEKGYRIFMQPVGTAMYTDAELLRLLEKTSELKPFAFYLVDTLGTMYPKDLQRMFYLIDHNLDQQIALGFHSHNNLQLSFANAQELIRQNTERSLIVDASVYGMGRGAGNLNTELITHYLNQNAGSQYDTMEILEILDAYILPLTLQYSWGYNAACYSASVSGCHPNYASFLLNRKTLRMQDIHAILNSLAPEKRGRFDPDYIEAACLRYLDHHVEDTAALEAVRADTAGPAAPEEEAPDSSAEERSI